jgi:AraC-like DNA-binding protein
MSLSQLNTLIKSSLTVPLHLKKHLIPWADVHYQQHEFGKMLAQQLRTQNFRIQQYRLWIEKSITLLPYVDNPVVIMQFMLGGQGIHGQLSGMAEEAILQEAACNIIYLPAGYHQVTLHTGEYRSLHVELSPVFLAVVADAWPLMQELLELLKKDSKKPCVLESVPLTYPMQCRINNLCTMEKQQPALTLELNSCILELLSCYQQGTVAARKLLSLPSVAYSDTLKTIMESIRRQPNIHEHSLKQLAKTHHMSMNTLSAGFKNLFDEHLSDFVLKECMLKAKLLLENRNLCLDDIAFELGYSDRTNFSRAFKRHHGVLPKEIRSGCKG